MGQCSCFRTTGNVICSGYKIDLSMEFVIFIHSRIQTIGTMFLALEQQEMLFVLVIKLN